MRLGKRHRQEILALGKTEAGRELIREAVRPRLLEHQRRLMIQTMLERDRRELPRKLRRKECAEAVIAEFLESVEGRAWSEAFQPGGAELPASYIARLLALSEESFDNLTELTVKEQAWRMRLQRQHLYAAIAGKFSKGKRGKPSVKVERLNAYLSDLYAEGYAPTYFYP